VLHKIWRVSLNEKHYFAFHIDFFSYPALQEIKEKAQCTEKKPKFNYEQFYSSPWAATEEDEKEHFKVMMKIREWPRDDPDSPVDGIQISLMLLIIGKRL